MKLLNPKCQFLFVLLVSITPFCFFSQSSDLIKKNSFQFEVGNGLLVPNHPFTSVNYERGPTFETTRSSSYFNPNLNIGYLRVLARKTAEKATSYLQVFTVLGIQKSKELAVLNETIVSEFFPYVDDVTISYDRKITDMTISLGIQGTRVTKKQWVMSISGCLDSYYGLKIRSQSFITSNTTNAVAEHNYKWNVFQAQPNRYVRGLQRLAPDLNAVQLQIKYGKIVYKSRQVGALLGISASSYLNRNYTWHFAADYITYRIGIYFIP